MKRAASSILLMLSLLAVIGQPKRSEPVFAVTPYLQIGRSPNVLSLQLLWHAIDSSATWLVEHRQTSSEAWIKTTPAVSTKIAVKGIPTHFVYRTTLSRLTPGSTFTYRVSKNSKQVFIAQAQAPRSANQAFRFIAFGDIGAGTPEAKQIANGVYNAKADLIVIPGDIVYDNGLIAEYQSRFWPIYNTATVDTAGVPLMCSVPFVGAVGNHDADSRNLDKAPDALAYFHYWDQPLNGPVGQEGGPFVPILNGSKENKKAFMAGAGDRYPRMTNFSFNYANAHYTFLDADTYVDWTDTTLINWVAKDLAAAKDADWRFVVYHHPGFNSSREHFEQQQMRLLAPVFETGKVDIVFNGHVHNYQRSFPMRFHPDNDGTIMVDGNMIPYGRVVNGQWTLDKLFDGKSHTKPAGVIYVVTGAGGQDLYNPEQQGDPDSWQKFTTKFISTIHSFTVVDVDGKTLTLRQLTANGKELDSIKVSK